MPDVLDIPTAVPLARSPAPRRPGWPAWVVAVGAPTVLVGLHGLLYGRWIVDDAAITFAYARSVATGAGPVVQPGAEAVEGYSNPAWLALLVGGRWLGLFDRGAWLGVPDYVAFPKLLALVLIAGTFACFFAVASVLSRRPVLVTVLAGAATAVVPSFVGPDTTVFRIAPSRSLKVLTEQLGTEVDADTGALPDTLPGGREVLLSSDFYVVYQSLGRMEGVANLWCWSHIRRYFVRAGDAHPELAVWTAGWVERIAALYVAHTALSAAEPGGPAHTWAGAQFSAALNTIDAERTTQSARPELLHPAAAKVLATLDREWYGLARHREFPELALDNNTSERALRGPVVGRKNYYGSGSVVSAQLASRVWTITATAARAGLNPLAYLRAYLDEYAQAGGTAPTGPALTRFLPWTASTEDHTAWARDPRPKPDTPTDRDRRWPTANGTSAQADQGRSPPADDHRRLIGLPEP